MTRIKRAFIYLLSITVSATMVSCGFFSDKQQSDKINSDSELELVGGERDNHGCIGSAGYEWSELRKKCIRPWEEGVRLLSVEDQGIAAYVLFNSDSSRVELFVIDVEKSVMLDRRATVNGNVWNVEDDDTFNLRQSEGKWVLERRGKVMYSQEE